MVYSTGMSASDKQGAIRLITIGIYMILMLPGLFAARRVVGEFTPPAGFLAASAAVFVLFVVLELVEFRVFRYEYRTSLSATVVFAARVAILLVHGGIFRSGLFPFHHNPMLSALLPLMAFYVYFAFPRRYGLVAVAAIVIGPAIVTLVRIVPLDQSPGPNALGFVIFRAVAGAFFFTFAWLWDTERRQARDNRRLIRELHTSERRLRDYAEQVGHTVALEERTRLARDIHDSIGHALTAITIQLNKAKAYSAVDRAEVERAVSAALETAHEAMQDVRESLVSLNGEASGVSIVRSVPRLVEQLQSAGLVVDYRLSGDETRYNYAVVIGLYRFLQESVTNIIKHAAAKTVTITIDLGPQEGLVTVDDDGDGFDMDVLEIADGTQGRFGLHGLRRRLELIGGFLEIRSAIGGGTTLRARVPRDPVSPLTEATRQDEAQPGAADG